MEEKNFPIDISVKNQQLPEQSIKPIRKPNYWKLGFIVVLLMLVLSIGLLVYFIKSNSNLSKRIAKSVIPDEISITPSAVPSATLQQDVVQGIFVKINPYRLDDEGEQIIATFQINNLNKESNISKVTYWTDKNGACKAKTEKFSEFIKIPASEIEDYVFFQFADDKNHTSEIYASSPNPIFQCGKLTE